MAQFSLGKRGKPIKWGTPTYNVWKGMNQKCFDKNLGSYHRYGGRGITVCERWLKFDNFLADMGERPEGLSLDRIDNNGNYEPGNCRWATCKQQAANRMATHRDITGSTFGRLTAIRYLHSEKWFPRWLFKCECGNETVKRSAAVINGSCRSCGCVQLESRAARFHGIKDSERGTKCSA